MGLVLDSSVLIVEEREAKPVSNLLAELQQGHGENEIVISVARVRLSRESELRLYVTLHVPPNLPAVCIR